jgi:hypothetical protein
MTRAIQIKDKLGYAESQRHQLMEHMYQAKKAGIEAKYIVHSASEILSTARECYDYCANDIVDDLLIPHTSKSKLLSRYRAGRLKIYFPFYPNELQDNEAFSELQHTNSALHDHLLRLSYSISKNEQVPNTMLKYGDILQLKDMVNIKKHDRLICVQSLPERELLVESPGMQMIIPSRGQRGWNTLSVSPGSYVSSVEEFLFEYNNREVGEFCLFATRSTEIILDEIYHKFFNSTIK